MKLKLIAVLVVITTIFIGAVLWRTDSFVYSDRISWVEAQTRTQLGAMNRTLATELKSLQRMVASLQAEDLQSKKVNWNSLTPYYAVASFSLVGNNLELQSLVTKENSKASAWTRDFIKSAVGNLTDRKADMKFFIKPFQDPQRGRFVGLIFIEGSQVFALFGSGEIFQSLIDAQRGALSSFSMVTSSGLTVGHSVPEYLGTVMRDDPVFKEASQSGASHGSNTFKLKSGALYGMYEVVPQSNLLLLSSAPVSEAMKGRQGLWWQFLLLGCGFIAVGTAAMLGIKEPASTAATSAPPPAVASSAAVPAVASFVDPELGQKEKMEASMRVASALAHEMRGPLASILGYAQNIVAQAPGTEILQSTDSILRETRSARAVLDKLLGFAGEDEEPQKNSLKLEGPLVKALKNLDATLSLKGVKVIKNIQDASNLDLHVDAIIRALTHIFQNSIEAMERMPKKEIHVNLFEDQQGVYLEIADTGEGIEPQNLQKIFDPFFTTRSFQNHMGLGLSVAFGVFKEHQADVQVESQRGQGTKVKIRFKKSDIQAVPKAPAFAAPLPPPREEIFREEATVELRQEPEAVVPERTQTFPVIKNIENLLELPDDNDNEGGAVTTRPIISMPEMKALPEEDAVASPDDFPTENKVNSPKAPASEKISEKKSRLDSFKVEIPRPGKRI